MALSTAHGELETLDRSRLKREDELKQLSTQIEHIKAEPPGMSRDRKLQDALAKSQTLANALDALSLQVKAAHDKEHGAERALIQAIDQIFSRTPSTISDDERIEYTRLRAQLTAALAEPVAVIVAPNANVAAGPLDGPRELRQKADTLRDSEDKLRREVARIIDRMRDVEKRRALREHAASVDDDLFGENSSNRGIARANTQSDHAPTAAQATGGNSAAAPVNAPASGPSAPVVISAPSGTRDSSLHNVLDPATFAELHEADRNGDVDQQTHALKRAQAELESLANELHKRADVLSRRADSLKNQK